MIPEDIQALALADAIGALDPEERRELEARLAALPLDVRAEVALLYDTSVDIAAGVLGEAPSPDVREALLARVASPANHTIAADEGEWVATPVPGVQMKILAIDRARDRVTMLREAMVPMPNGDRPVSPWRTEILAGSMPSSSCAICDSVVSSPWPCDWMPTSSTSVPSGISCAVQLS